MVLNGFLRVIRFCQIDHIAEYTINCRYATRNIQVAIGGHMAEKKNLMTVREAAGSLGLSVACLRAWIAARRITFVRLGRAVRIPRRVLTELIERNTVGAKRTR